MSARVVLIVFAAMISSCEMEETTANQTLIPIATGFDNGSLAISGTPEVFGFTDSLDLTPYDSVRITFMSSFSVFPSRSFEDPYSVFIRRRELPGNLVFFDWPQLSMQTHEVMLRTADLLNPGNTSFEIRARSNAPAEEVFVTISDVAVTGHRR